MKTSNTIIISALVFLVVALFVYDYQLKEEYTSGRYKDPYRDFTTLNFKDFDAVDVKSTTVLNVKFMQGPFKVMADTAMLKNIMIKQNGHQLTIRSVFNQTDNYNANPYLVYIWCPKLKELNADAVYTANNKLTVDTALTDYWHSRQNLVEGFTEDSLTLVQHFGSGIILSGNHINALTVTAGTGEKSNSKTSILKNNHIGQASFEILNASRLLLDGQSIQNLQYHLADSANLTFTGAVQNTISNAKPYHK